MKTNLQVNLAPPIAGGTLAAPGDLPNLAELRAEIDRIDDAMLDLLEQRYAVVRRVTEAKAGETSTTLPVRPLRERRIVERLAARSHLVPTEDIAHIWRAVLALSARSQRNYKVILWAPDDARLALATLVAARFGSTIPVEWAPTADAAIAAARAGEAILLMPADKIAPSDVPELDLIGQYPLDNLHHPWALAMGRLAAEAELPVPGVSVAIDHDDWNPSTWEGRVHHQMPTYRNERLLRAVRTLLAQAEPVVVAESAATLKQQIAQAQVGCAYLIQAGDCAEPIDAGRPETLRMAGLIEALAGRLEHATGTPTLRIGRLAGQFAKPRSASAEQAGDALLPVYRGDAVNDMGASAEERAADPSKLWEAYEQSCRVNSWLIAGAAAEGGHAPYVSHEALLLPYEAALTRRDALTGEWWARSAHTLWLGDRTRDPHGAHVEFLRGVANPIGIKCGPTMAPDQLLRLLERIDERREAGRIMLIARLGHDKVGKLLQPMMDAVAAAGHPVLWLCDPMHGNNRSIDGMKFRLLADMVGEVESFAQVAAAAGVHAGGLHMEVTPSAVAECVADLDQLHPERTYQSRCDPRLNRAQAMQLVDAFAAALEGGA